MFTGDKRWLCILYGEIVVLLGCEILITKHLDAFNFISHINFAANLVGQLCYPSDQNNCLPTKFLSLHYQTIIQPPDRIIEAETVEQLT